MAAFARLLPRPTTPLATHQSPPPLPKPSTFHVAATQRLPSKPATHKAISTQQCFDCHLLAHNPKPPRDAPNSLLHGCPPESAAYLAAIQSCNSLNLAVQIHAHAVKNAFAGSRTFLETKLVELYGRWGAFEDAHRVFEEMPVRSLYSWVAVLSTCVDYEYYLEVIWLFERLIFEDVELEFFVFPVLLRACSGMCALELGRQLHGFVIKGEYVSNAYVGNALIDMYGKCGSLEGALVVFDRMPEKDGVSWNSAIATCATNGLPFKGYELLQRMKMSPNVMPNIISWSTAIGGLLQNGYDEEALQLLHEMQDSGLRPNAQTLASVLPSCGRLGNLKIGMEIHGYIVRHNLMWNTILANGLLDVYRRSGDMDSAMKIFSRFSALNVVSFNTMIVGYCDNGDVKKAKVLFDKMEFHGIKRDTISWNAMISGYVNNELFICALKLFKSMQIEEDVVANSFTVGSALSSCTGMTSLSQGKEIHSFVIVRGLHHDPIVGGALIDMYCKCQDLISAQMVFGNISERDISIWNVLISGFARCGKMDNALELLSEIRIHGLHPDVYTWNGLLAGYLGNSHYVSLIKLFVEMQNSGVNPDFYSMGMLLSACTGLASIQMGQQAHAYSIKHAWDLDVHVGSSLVDMYAKCGTIKEAESAFHIPPHQNLVFYNTMLAGFALHGLSKKAISLFHQLVSDGLTPDAVTFLSVLSSCTHEGNIEEGFRFFNLMREFNIKPELKHYTCMVDILSRAGSINEAFRVVQTMPMEPDEVILGALLNGCIMHKNVEIGELVAKRLVEINKEDAGNYIMLANLYASLGRSNEFAKARQLLRTSGMKKAPGCSWIEHQDQVHVFVASDGYHKRADEIYRVMDVLYSHMKDVETIECCMSHV